MARLAGKTAIVVGAGQTPGDTIGNGRAMAMLFAREGAKVMCVDRNLARADDTVAAITAEGGKAWSHAADITRTDDVAGIFDAALGRWREIDILVNNPFGWMRPSRPPASVRPKERSRAPAGWGGRLIKKCITRCYIIILLPDSENSPVLLLLFR